MDKRKSQERILQKQKELYCPRYRKVFVLAAMAGFIVMTILFKGIISAYADEKDTVDYDKWDENEFSFISFTSGAYPLYSKEVCSKSFQLVYNSKTNVAEVYDHYYGGVFSSVYTKNGRIVTARTYEGKNGQGIIELFCLDDKGASSIKQFSTEDCSALFLFECKKEDSCLVLLTHPSTDNNGEKKRAGEWSLNMLNLDNLKLETIKAGFDYSKFGGITVSPDGNRIIIAEHGTENKDKGQTISSYSLEGKNTILYTDPQAQEKDFLWPMFCDNNGNVLLKSTSDGGVTEEGNGYILRENSKQPESMGCTFTGVQANKNCSEFVLSSKEGVLFFGFDMKKPQKVCDGNGIDTTMLLPDQAAFDMTAANMYGMSAFSTRKIEVNSFNNICFLTDDYTTIYKIDNFTNCKVKKLLKGDYFAGSCGLFNRMRGGLFTEADYITVSQDCATIIASDGETIYTIDVKKGTAKEVYHPEFTWLGWAFVNKDYSKALLIADDGEEIIKEGVLLDLKNGKTKTVNMDAYCEVSLGAVAKVQNETFDGVVYVSDGALVLMDYDGHKVYPEVPKELGESLKDVLRFVAIYIRGNTILHVESKEGNTVDFYSVSEKNKVTNIYELAGRQDSLENDEKPEIYFRDIPWGTSFGEVKSILSELDFMPINGENIKTYSQDDILLGDYQGIDFTESGFNYICSSFEQLEVAGYTTEDIDIYCVMPVENGKLIHDEDSALLYGATYEFKPRDIKAMQSDIISKLTQLYGEPAEEKKLSDWSAEEIKCYIWEGSNGYISVRAEDYPSDALSDDTLTINYVCKDADKWMQNANDAWADEQNEAEAEHYGGDNTSGL